MRGSAEAERQVNRGLTSAEESQAVALERSDTQTGQRLELMARADVAVTAGGSTCWEAAFMGLPSIVVSLAGNQRETAEGLGRYGAALNLGWARDVSESTLARVLQDVARDPARREAMSEKGRRLVDGSGGRRVVGAMRSDGGDGLRVRRARGDDAELVWEWANDPTVRARSFRPDPIPLDEHLEWYRGRLASPDTRLWIIERHGAPVAQIWLFLLAREV